MKWPEKRAELRRLQDNLCCWCGQPMQQSARGRWDYETIEHLTPRVHGGGNGIKNLALAHKRCNHRRGTIAREPLFRRVVRKARTPLIATVELKKH